MPIKWSAIEVSEAMDKAEEQIMQAIPCLEEARAIAGRARLTENLPQYVDQRITSLIFEITRAVGGSHLEPLGRPRAAIKSVRESIPDGAIEEEQAKTKYGDQVTML